MSTSHPQGNAELFRLARLAIAVEVRRLEAEELREPNANRVKQAAHEPRVERAQRLDWHSADVGRRGRDPANLGGSTHSELQDADQFWSLD